MNQPSKETKMLLLKLMQKTSLPKILAQKNKLKEVADLHE
jgi:hypothetical protein